jgi:hypothetical protein
MELASEYSSVFVFVTNMLVSFCVELQKNIILFLAVPFPIS